jgi:hypothetical protein
VGKDDVTPATWVRPATACRRKRSWWGHDLQIQSLDAAARAVRARLVGHPRLLNLLEGHEGRAGDVEEPGWWQEDIVQT